MWQYILLMLHRQRSRNVLASSGFLLAACALILLSATTQSTVLQAKQIISRNWRSTYDLVVLPPHTSLPTGKAIPANLFESIAGGISIQQYQQIKRLSGVEIAAPIAYIGYAQDPFTLLGGIGPKHLAPGFYRFEWTQTAFNGRQKVTENHDFDGLYVNPQVCNDTTSLQGQQEADARLKLAIRCIDGKGSYLSFVPNTGTFLVAAIDPDAENHLLHLSQTIVGGRMLTRSDGVKLDKLHSSLPALLQSAPSPNYDVPLLLNIQFPERMNITVSFVRLPIDTLDPKVVLARGGQSYMDHLPAQNLFTAAIPIAQNDPRVFSQGEHFDWNGHGWQFHIDRGFLSYNFNFVSAPTGLTYQPASVPSGQSGLAYSLLPAPMQGVSGTTGTEVAFRDLHPFAGEAVTIETASAQTSQYLRHTYNGNFYTPQIVGQFDGKRVAAQFTSLLNWLPEGTYAEPSALLRYDAQGRPVSPTPLFTTANPTGFLLQPPQALTTLSAAEQILGNRSISVIRVRVAGNIAPDQRGWQRVAQVAQSIQRSTGLRAIVTLGSSPSPTLIYVPGIKVGQDGATQNIAPLGWVEERWISLGVALVYLNQLGQTRTLLLGAVLLVCLGYLFVTLSSLAEAQRKEFAILNALGWEPQQSAVSFVIQALLLALVGGVLGVGLALLIAALIGVSPLWSIVIWTLPAIVGLALLSTFYPFWQLWHLQPAEMLRTRASVSFNKSSSKAATGVRSHLPAVGGMALSNLLRSRVRALIASGSLFLSAILLTVMVDGILAFHQTLQGTLLGEYVLVQTAVPQLAGAFFAILLTFLSVADLLLLQVRERRKEIGLLQAIGWRPRLVQRLFMQEGLALAVVGTIPGVLLALLLLALQHQTQNTVPTPLIGMGTVLLMLAVSALATLPAMRAANRIPLMDILRAE